MSWILFLPLGGGNNRGPWPWPLTNSPHSQLALCAQRELIKENRAKERKRVLGQMESLNRRAGDWGREGQDWIRFACAGVGAGVAGSEVS